MPDTVTDTVALVEGVEGPVFKVDGASQRMSASDPWKEDIAVPLAGGHGNDPDTGSQPVVMARSHQSYKGGSDRRDTASARTEESFKGFGHVCEGLFHPARLQPFVPGHDPAERKVMKIIDAFLLQPLHKGIVF
jgi:hypothetical protein